MTDTNKDKNVQEHLDAMSFKEKILADLAIATQERQRKREEWHQQDLSMDKNAKIDKVVVGETLEVESTKFVSKGIPENAEELEPGSPKDNVENNISKVNSEAHSESSALFHDQKEIVENSLEETKELPNLKEFGKTTLPTNDELAVWTTQQVESVNRNLDSDIEKIGVKEMSRESRRKANRLAAKISTVFVSLLVLVILSGGFFTYRYVTSAIGPLDSQATDYIQVEIPSGSGNKLIGNILKEHGVIKDSRVFNFYTKFKNYSNFQSGFYNFQKSMSLDDIAKYLQQGGTAEPQKPVLGKIAIPEGYTLKQIAQAVALNANTEEKGDNTPYTAEEFMSTVQDESFIAEMVQKYPKLLGSLPEASAVKYRLEGYLFPATYDYYEGTTINDIIDQMLAAMDTNLAPYYEKITTNGMTVNQVLSLASLVEKEGATDDDRKMIASVFYNRWNIGQPLQSNIAILYAMDKLGEKTTLAEDAAIDTSINSPYNIYLNTGLMPGPVDSPGLSALVATINPANTKYYYFVADVTTGAVYFAETYEEHSANVEKYVNSKLQ